LHAKWAITTSFPSLKGARLGLANGIYAGFAVLSFVFVRWVITETNGRELEAMPEQVTVPPGPRCYATVAVRRLTIALRALSTKLIGRSSTRRGWPSRDDCPQAGRSRPSRRGARIGKATGRVSIDRLFVL
jgi:hypothetical protein